MTQPTLVWLRQDLRLDDQPAIAAAAAAGPFAALYVLDDDTPGDWAIGGAQRWWLHHSLASLKRDIEARGGALILRRGRSATVVPAVAAELGASTIHATRHYEPWWRAAEEALGDRLELHAADTLVPLPAVHTTTGKPFRIYTPFLRAHARMAVPPPEPATERFEAPARLPASDRMEQWDLLPTRPNWAAGFSLWAPGESGAAARLSDFVALAEAYASARNLPSQAGTSMLSAHLHFGEISPRRVWWSLPDNGAEKFRNELVWRDFSRNVIATDPQVGDRPQRPAMVTWRIGKAADADFERWTRGTTGYPIIDAGMRQLWATGWMHNRVRMLAASFLVKHLLIDWRRGERWFWDTLVDADYGNNSQSWQWIAGTGIDSQPFNRIMAPLAQSAKFDAAGYIKQWVPELAQLSDEDIHEPVDVPGYPAPMIGHQEARERLFAARRRSAYVTEPERISG